ncbi:uncharacterized protein PG998_000096 [Apiospora kogelbergensis]|uniref:uncharacterized protein n=1 Tax=Apiospora kogelbergensis TaxID=1337665 RepID=UPI00312D5351
MVNRGKPSLDCQHCKRRKLRCDLQLPTCGQCGRAGIHCFGRRDPNELIILDQTHSTSRKVLSNHVLRCPSTSASPAIPCPLLPALEVRAREAFSLTMCADDPLSAAVDAAALLFLAKHYQTPGRVAAPVRSSSSGHELSRLATAQYVTAIKRLGNALHASRPANTDAALQTALVLDLYEKLAAAGEPGPKAVSGGEGEGALAWMSHVRGALSLVRAYGLAGRLASPVTRQLAARLAMTLVISCGAAGSHVPRELAELRTGLAPYFAKPVVETSRAGRVMGPAALHLDPKFAVTGVVAGVVNLAADVGQGTLSPDEVSLQALVLDQRFVEMEQALPSSWHFTRVSTDGKYPRVYAGYYDLYSDHYVTQVRNVLRTMRLLLAKIVIVYGDTETTTGTNCQRHNSKIYVAIEKLCDEIASSVPQFTWAKARTESKIPFTPLQSLQCFTLLSPLYAAGQLTCRRELQSWILTTLDYMANSGGLHMAKMVAEVLRRAPETSYWHVYSMLGSYAFAA